MDTHSKRWKTIASQERRKNASIFFSFYPEPLISWKLSDKTRGWGCTSSCLLLIPISTRARCSDPLAFYRHDLLSSKPKQFDSKTVWPSGKEEGKKGRPRKIIQLTVWIMTQYEGALRSRYTPCRLLLVYVDLTDGRPQQSDVADAKAIKVWPVYVNSFRASAFSTGQRKK